MKWPLRTINQDREYYLSQAHLLVDDIRELKDEYDRLEHISQPVPPDMRISMLQRQAGLIEGAQRHLQYVQNKVEN